MDENIIEVRRFINQATPAYWAGFHAWFKTVRPQHGEVVHMPKMKFRHMGAAA